MKLKSRQHFQYACSPYDVEHPLSVFFFSKLIRACRQPCFLHFYAQLHDHIFIHFYKWNRSIRLSPTTKFTQVVSVPCVIILDLNIKRRLLGKRNTQSWYLEAKSQHDYTYIYTQITMGHSLKVMPIRSTKLLVPRLEVM